MPGASYFTDRLRSRVRLIRPNDSEVNREGYLYLFYGSRSIVRPIWSGQGSRVFQKQLIPFLPIYRDVVQERRNLLSLPPASSKKEVVESCERF